MDVPSELQNRERLGALVCVGGGGGGVLVGAAGGVRQHLESQGHSVQSQCKGIADNHQLYPLDIAPIRG